MSGIIYTPIPVSATDVESPITESLMRALADNPAAIACGSTGAPKILEAAFNLNSIHANRLRNNTVGQTQLKTSVASYSTALNANPSGDDTVTVGQTFVSAAGAYGFSVRGSLSGTGAASGDENWSARVEPQGALAFNTGPGSVPVSQGLATRIAILASASADDNDGNDAEFNGTGSAQQFYVTASPPYNLGHGDIAHFVYFKLDNENKIVAQYWADTPPWAYNGPTDIRPDKVEIDASGNLVKKKTVICADKIPLHPLEGGDFDTYLEFMSNPICEEILVDDAIKNADMNLIPHPFELLPGESVVLLDPTSDMTDKLAMLHESGEDVTKLVNEGLIEIEGEIVDCNKPNGVCVHSASWKKS